MAYPLTRRTNRAQLAEWFRLPESVRAFENLQSDVIELFKRSFTDAPRDGKIYGRRDGTWVEGISALFTATTPGMVPPSGGSATKFLRADGKWAVPGAPGEDSFLIYNNQGEFADMSTANDNEGVRWLKNERTLSILRSSPDAVNVILAYSISDANFQLIAQTGAQGTAGNTVVAKLGMRYAGVQNDSAMISFVRGDFADRQHAMRFSIDGNVRFQLHSGHIAEFSTGTSLYLGGAGPNFRTPLRFRPSASPPSQLTDGDVWFTAAGLFYRAGGATVGPLWGAGGPAVGLDDLAGVSIASPVAGQLLSYDGAQWVNARVATAAQVLCDDSGGAILFDDSGDAIYEDAQ